LKPKITRRTFLGAAAIVINPSLAGFKKPERFFFTTQGRTAMMNADGTGLHIFDFKVPDQVTWQPGPFFSDGKRVVFLSMEQRRDGPGRPFEEYYTQTPTHLWVYDVESKTLKEIVTRDRLAVFYTPALLVSDERILVQVVRNKVGQIFSMNLDGSDAKGFTRAGEGLPYGLSLSPDRKRVAFHLASPQGYQIWTSDITGGNRTRIVAHPDSLFFGPVWSPDGKWLAYLDCHYKQDPGHDWADVCVAAVDGEERRSLTSGQAHWFGATYGGPKTRGGGSNMLAWTRDGDILFSRKQPHSKVPWEYQPNRPDTDHFNRDFKPEAARGGTEICRLKLDGTERHLTSSGAGVWDLRASESPDGKQVVFCRAGTGEPLAVWIMDRDGRNQRLLSKGLEDAGADQPRWMGR
jgi:TolB protein